MTDINGCTASAAWFFLNNTGVNNIFATDVSIYPNPATSTLYIQSRVNVKAVITGVDGKLVMEQADAKEMNVSSLASGVYIISLYDNDGQALLTQKLIKE